MNILLASRELPGINDGGGIGVYTLTWAKSLQKEGHYVRVVTSDPKHPVNLQNYPFAVEMIEEDRRFSHVAQGYSYALYQRLLALSRERHWDIIEFPDYLGEGYFTIKAKRLCGEFADTVLRVHGHMSLELCDVLNQEIPDSNRRTIHHMERYALRFCDVLTVPSQDLQSRYRHATGREVLLTRHPLPKLPLPPESESSLQSTSQTRQNPDEPVILYVGRLEYRKGVDLLLKAAKVLWEQDLTFGLWLIGQDTRYQGRSFQKQLEALIPAPYHGYVHFAGDMSREQLSRYYAKAAAVVFPSRFENWPNVCLEAMSLGCPVIASKSGGMREMLSGGAGILVNPEHTPSFAMALQSVLEDSLLSAQLKDASLQAITHLDVRASDILAAVLPHASTSSREPKALERTRWPKISVIISPRNGEGSNGWEQTVDSIKQSGYPAYEIVAAHPNPLGSLDEWWPLEQIQGDFVLFLEAGEWITESFLYEAVTALERHPDIEAVYPMVQEDSILYRWQVPDDGTKARILLPGQSLIRPLVNRHALFRFLPEGEGMHPRDDTGVWRLLIQMVEDGVHPELLPVFGIGRVKTSESAWRRRLWHHQENKILGEGGFELALWYADEKTAAHFEHAAGNEPVQIIQWARRLSRRLPSPIAIPMKRLWKKWIRLPYEEDG